MVDERIHIRIDLEWEAQPAETIKGDSGRWDFRKGELHKDCRFMKQER